MVLSRQALPPTVNLHIVGHCNYNCGYCYARFEQAKTFMPAAVARDILAKLRAEGVTRITFAGGEPTLHPDLVDILRACAEFDLTTSLVTNGSRLDRNACRRLFPLLRWLVLSCDSHTRETNDRLGRRLRVDPVGQPTRVDQIAGWVREWNAHRPEDERVRLKINLVVTSLNVEEDPSDWLLSLQPERVKLLQCCILPGENDDAGHLRCDADSFERYRARLTRLEAAGVTVVAEREDDLLDSYAMVDPLGRFRQGRRDGYVHSQPISAVGVRAAWHEVGGCDLELFRARGGEYAAGPPSRGLRHPIVGIEGLDGSGKSTVAYALAARLEATVVSSPPARMLEERAAADASPAGVRRAWYWKAGIETMRDATDLVFAAAAVILDRCHVSTAVYSAAEQGRVASRADIPRDPPLPDLIVFLALPEEQRRRRLLRRGSALTAEEDRLASDDEFRQRVVDGYGAMSDVRVDAGLAVGQVVDRVIALMYEREVLWCSNGQCGRVASSA